MIEQDLEVVNKLTKEYFETTEGMADHTHFRKGALAALEYARTPQPAKSDSHGVTKINGANFRGFQLGLIGDPKHHSYGWVVYENPDKNGWVFLQDTGIAHLDQAVQELVEALRNACDELYTIGCAATGPCGDCIQKVNAHHAKKAFLDAREALAKFESRGSNEAR